MSHLQLLINIPFNQKVKLQTLVVKGPKDAGPKVMFAHMASSVHQHATHPA